MVFSEKQERDIQAMKRVAREVFYPSHESKIQSPVNSDEAFIPQHIKEEAKILMNHPLDNKQSTMDDDPSIEAFIPEIDALGDAALARDVFFPFVGHDEETPTYLSSFYKEIEELIAECKSAIAAGHMSYAKKIYNQVRITFMSADIKEEDQKVLHDKIQSLYDSINLKNLEEEAKKRLR